MKGSFGTERGYHGDGVVVGRPDQRRPEDDGQIARLHFVEVALGRHTPQMRHLHNKSFF